MIDWDQARYLLSKSSQFCNSGVLRIIGSTCSNETRTRKTSFSFSSYFCQKLSWEVLHLFCHLLYGYTESTDCFIVQNIILFKHTIQIALWARIIRYDGKIRKNYVQSFGLRWVLTTLTWCMLCWCDGAICCSGLTQNSHAPDLQ